MLRKDALPIADAEKGCSVSIYLESASSIKSLGFHSFATASRNSEEVRTTIGAAMQRTTHITFVEPLHCNRECFSVPLLQSLETNTSVKNLKIFDRRFGCLETTPKVSGMKRVDSSPSVTLSRSNGCSLHRTPGTEPDSQRLHHRPFVSGYSNLPLPASGIKMGKASQQSSKQNESVHTALRCEHSCRRKPGHGARGRSSKSRFINPRSDFGQCFHLDSATQHLTLHHS